MGARLRDIAQKLGISVTTVSLALKGHPRITEKRRQQVLRVARKMGYQPNLLARALATGRAGIIGLIISDNSNPFYAEVIQGVEDVASSAGMSVILANTYREPKREGAALRTLLSRKVDGVILSPVRTPGHQLEDDRYLRALAKEGFPLIIITRSVDDPDFHAVSVDNVDLALAGVRHLVNRGHRQICYLGSESRTHPDAERLRGYQRALEESGIGVPEKRVLRCAPNLEGGYQGARRLFETGRGFTAVFTFNDAMAIGAMRYFREQGLSIPGDLAILGCDDIEMSRYSLVSLSTMRIPKYEMGCQAAEAILGIIRGEFIQRVKIILKAELVERESTRTQGREIGEAEILIAVHNGELPKKGES